ncbi:MAG: hypothetical protein ACTHKL_13170 [Streptosporangiaceae bacterium]
MSNVPSNEYVSASDLKPGDKLLYTTVVITVVHVRPTPEGVEIECTDGSGTARLCLHRGLTHQFEVIR